MKTFNQTTPVAADRRNSSFFTLNRAFATAILLSCLASPMQAAITGTGDIDPTDPTAWDLDTIGYIGKTSTGSIIVDDASELLSDSGYLGYDSGSSGSVTVTGASSKWILSGKSSDFNLFVGENGSGTLNIEAGGLVRPSPGSPHVYIGDMPGSSGTVTVTGTNSMLIYDYVHVGIDGSAALNIKAGGLVSSEFCYLGNISSATSTTTVSGVGSTLSVSERIEIKGLALEPAGDTLNVKSGGQINSKHGWVINSTIRVTDAGSKWSISDELWFISSTLNIEAGGEVNNLDGKINESAGSTVTVTGAGSKWINRGTLYVGEQSSSNPGNSTLNIGSGIASDGMVMAKEFVLRLGTCNLNGGTLQTGIIRTETAATFNWSDGTIRNLDANTNLGVGGVFSLKLASTGTHAFYIDAGRIGSIGAILCDSTSGGTLEKQGGGSLTLSGANTYTGSTTIAAGKLTLSSTGSLASSPIDVKSGATFDVSAKKGYVLAAGKTLTGSGTIVGDLSVGGIHAPGNSTGVETVKGNYSLLGELQIELAGTTAGTGYDEVLISGSSAYNAALSGTLSLDWTSFNGSTDATQLWIVKNDTAGTLSGAFSNYANGASLGLHDGRSWNLYYNADAATGNLTGGNDVLIAPVPEPATIILLALSALAALVWSRKSRVGQA